MALSPHLAEVDKVLPTEVTREQIFPKVFADPLTIRHELTAMIGQSVRRYPKGSTEGEFSVEDRISILSELKNHIEEVGKKTKFTKEVGRFLTSDRESQDFEDRLDALVIEAGGYLTGLKGTNLDETIVDVSKQDAERVVDKNIYGALAFLNLVGMQDVKAYGSLKPFERETAKNFLLGAGKVWNSTPKFVHKLSRYWGKTASGYTVETSDDLSKSIGQIVSQITEPRLKLGIAARLPKSLMVKLLHLYEVEKFIYARGWLKGYIEYSEDQGSGEWASYLRSNVSTIIIRGMHMRNPGYVIKAVKALPKILDAIQAKAEELDDDLARILLSNKGSIISQALGRGTLEKHIILTSDKLSKIVDSVTTGAEELGDKLADIVLSRKATIITSAINKGWETYPTAIFEALPKIIDGIETAAEKLDDELAEILLSNKGSIIHRAITSGKLEKYPPQVFKALPRIADTISAHTEEAKGTDEELARILMLNKGSIIHRAIASGKLERYPFEVFEALPRIADAIAAQAKEMDEKLAGILLSNRGTIINQAINSGKLKKYHLEVFDALPKIVDGIEAMAKELDDDLADVLLSNRGSIINSAIHSGRLENYLPILFEALPKIVHIIATKAEEMDEELAEILLANRGSIIYYALTSRKLEAYVEAVCAALPQIAQCMDRGSLHRALHDGKLDGYE
jgi:hypothetical protein